MSLDKKQLEINFNLHALQPSFLNLELHYIIATSEHAFRFAKWSEEPAQGEYKFYCFLSDCELFIPAGNITLKESYVVTTEPVYPLVKDHTDFMSLMEKMPLEHGVAKGIRRFNDADIAVLKESLCNVYGDCDQHVVTSAEGQHQLFVVKNIEISVSATMVYFRHKALFSEAHYSAVKENTIN